MSDKKSKKIDLDKHVGKFSVILINIIVSLMVFVFAKQYTDGRVNDAMNQSVDYITKMPSVKVFNPNKVASEMSKNGATSQQIVSYIERYIKLHEALNVILIDTQSAVAAPKGAAAPEYTIEELNELSQKYGIKSEYSVEQLVKDFYKENQL